MAGACKARECVRRLASTWERARPNGWRTCAPMRRFAIKTPPPPIWRRPKEVDRHTLKAALAAEERAAWEARIARDNKPAPQLPPPSLTLEEEQRDYVLGITSLWMTVPIAHGMAGLAGGPPLVEVLQSLQWHGNPFSLSTVEFEALRHAALSLVLLPTCTVSLASWRWPAHATLAEADRFGAKLFVVGLLAGNLPGFGPLPPSVGLGAFPAATFLCYGASALADGIGVAVGRIWSHAAFRCTAGWWSFASLSSDGLPSIEPWYFGLVTCVYWGHVAWSLHWTGRTQSFRAAEHYVRGSLLVGAMAAAAVCINPG